MLCLLHTLRIVITEEETLRENTTILAVNFDRAAEAANTSLVHIPVAIKLNSCPASNALANER